MVLSQQLLKAVAAPAAAGGAGGGAAEEKSEFDVVSKISWWIKTCSSKIG